MTTEEVCLTIGVDHKSISSRISALKRAGLVEETPFRRSTKAGGSQIVYAAIKDAPEEKYQEYLKEKQAFKGTKELIDIWQEDVLQAARIYAVHGGINGPKLLEVAARYPLKQGGTKQKGSV
jgi:DNA-binding transcriptional ArsR family regulator